GAQVAELEAVLDTGPGACGYADKCWTLARIADQVWQRFGVEYTLAEMDVVLHRIGWSGQVPPGGRRPGRGGRAAGLGAWVVLEDEPRQGLRPPKGRTWGRRGATPLVRVTGGHDTRVPLAALIAVRPGWRPRLIYRVHHGRHGKDQRKGFTEA